MPKYVTQAEAIDLINSYIDKEYNGVKTRAAENLNVSKQYLNAVLKLKTKPSEKLLRAINLEKVVLYERSNRS